MKMKRNRLLAFLLVCAIGVTCGACGKSGDSSTSAKDKDSSSAADNSSANDSDSAETNVNQANSEDVQKMLEQNRKLQMSDYELSSGNSNVPVNEGANQGSGNSGSEDSYVTVTDDSGATVTDDNGKAVTQKASGGNSSNSNSTTTSGSNSKSTTGCKQLYWLDTSQGGDFYPDGDFVDITFKIKDDAKDGNYTLGFGSGGDASQFANYDAEDVAVTYVDGDIAVGSASQKQEGSAGSGCTLIAGTAKGNQGDEVTVRYSISNCPGICAMILRVTYDTSALEVTGYEVGSGAGDIEKLES